MKINIVCSRITSEFCIHIYLFQRNRNFEKIIKNRKERYTHNIFASVILQRGIRFPTRDKISDNLFARESTSLESLHTHRDFLLNHLFVIPSDIIDPRFSAANTPTCGKHEEAYFYRDTSKYIVAKSRIHRNFSRAEARREC